MARYQPPKQSGFGQFFDSMFVLVLVYASLLLPLVIDFGGEEAAGDSAATAAVTWESLGQNAVMQQQWDKLGVGIDDAAAIINDRFDYTIDPLWLIVTIVVVVGYFFLLFRFSDQEYKEVLAEKFDNK